MDDDMSMFEDELEDFEDDSTIEDTIEKGQQILLSYINLCMLNRLTFEDNEEDFIDVPDHNLAYDYLDELKEASTKIKLSDSEFIKYKYRPDLFSYDLYGTTNYEYIILAINDIISPKYFTKQTLYVIDPEYIEDIITDIYNSELETINLNRSSYDSTNTIDTSF